MKQDSSRSFHLAKYISIHFHRVQREMLTLLTLRKVLWNTCRRSWQRVVGAKFGRVDDTFVLTCKREVFRMRWAVFWCRWRWSGIVVTGLHRLVEARRMVWTHGSLHFTILSMIPNLKVQKKVNCMIAARSGGCVLVTDGRFSRSVKIVYSRMKVFSLFQKKDRHWDSFKKRKCVSKFTKNPAAIVRNKKRFGHSPPVIRHFEKEIHAPFWCLSWES